METEINVSIPIVKLNLDAREISISCPKTPFVKIEDLNPLTREERIKLLAEEE